MACEPEAALWSRSHGVSAAAELTSVIERQLKESRAIDTEALCIVAGEKVCVQEHVVFARLSPATVGLPV
jgi:exosome complex RNA-binding protein Rrp42 (RNase PH superfamily)